MTIVETCYREQTADNGNGDNPESAVADHQEVIESLTAQLFCTNRGQDLKGT